MRRINVLVVLISLGALGACRSAPKVEPVPTGPMMPDTIAGFRRTAQSLVGRDSVWRYTNGNAHVSVIRYALTSDVKVGTDTSGWLAREGDKFIRVMPMLKERGAIDAYEVKSSKVGDGPAPPRREYVGIVVNTIKGKRSTELQYLYLVKNRWLKVRASEAEGGNATSTVPRFARALASRVARMTP